MENITIYGSGRNTEESISYYTTDKILTNYDDYESFIKGCEHCVRKDDRYTAYISKLKSKGLDKCFVLGNMEDEKVTVEMHHGPIFNLFDICDIVTRALLKRGVEDLTTYDVGDVVLEEHERDNIMIVMLSKTPHKGGHVANLFLSIKATFGQIDRFIDRFDDGMESEHRNMLYRYLDTCEQARGNTMDNGLFDTATQLKSFK